MIPFAMTIFVYFAELYLFLLDYISSFYFWSMLVLLVLLWPLFLFGIRKTQISKHVLLFSFISSLFLLFFEFPIMFTEENNYLVSSYVPPEELVKNSGILLLPVSTTEVRQKEVLNEKAYRDLYNHLIIFDIKHVSNFELYAGKTIAIFKMLGINLEDDEFQQMSGNVKAYLNTTNPAINEFLSKSNLGGDSAGLALVLSSFIEQREIKNDIPIGVTGAISKSGKVKEVHFIKEKILSANKFGLSHIILPIGNLDEAHGVVTSFNLPIEVIGVNNVEDAIEQINKVNQKK